MSNTPEYVVWEALKPVMPRSSANHIAHIVVTALTKSGWIASGDESCGSQLPQPSEVNWDALKPEMFETNAD